MDAPSTRFSSEFDEFKATFPAAMSVCFPCNASFFESTFLLRSSSSKKAAYLFWSSFCLSSGLGPEPGLDSYESRVSSGISRCTCGFPPAFLASAVAIANAESSRSTVLCRPRSLNFIYFFELYIAFSNKFYSILFGNSFKIKWS